MLHAANLGDSGFLVLRDGDVVFRSRPQQHSFNFPFQLHMPGAVEGEVAAQADVSLTTWLNKNAACNSSCHRIVCECASVMVVASDELM